MGGAATRALLAGERERGRGGGGTGGGPEGKVTALIGPLAIGGEDEGAGE